MDFLQLVDELGIDVAQELERFSNNEALLKRFICKFPQEKTYSQILEAFTARDYFAIEQHVHTLKGITANLGLEKLCELCVQMLEDLRGHRVELDAEFERINVEYNRVVDMINLFLSQSNG